MPNLYVCSLCLSVYCLAGRLPEFDELAAKFVDAGSKQVRYIVGVS